jgi:hypothetical protein
MELDLLWGGLMDFVIVTSAVGMMVFVPIIELVRDT